MSNADVLNYFNKFHSPEECKLFRSRGIIQTQRSLRMVYLIRCVMLRERDPVKWLQLLDLAQVSTVDGSNQTSSTPCSYFTSDQDKQDCEYLKAVCGYDDMDIEFVARLNGVKMVNGFGFCNSDSDCPRYHGFALYFQVSMASHGCSPNLTTHVVYDAEEGFPMKFYTKCCVRKGEKLQIAYRDRWLLLGTPRRREKIFQDHKFWCQCPRCEDPTENGTYFTSIRCSNCGPSDASFLLPMNPLDPKSLWKCILCASIKTEDEVSEVLEMATNDIESILMETINQEAIFSKLTQYLNGNGNIQLLHPNSYLRIRAELEWIKNFPFERLSSRGGSGDDEETLWTVFVLLIDRAQHSKIVYDLLVPNWSEQNSKGHLCLTELINYKRSRANYSVDYLPARTDYTIGKAIFTYYFKSDRIRSLPNDLALDLTAIALKHLQRGEQDESEIASSADVFDMVQQLSSYVTAHFIKLADNQA